MPGTVKAPLRTALKLVDWPEASETLEMEMRTRSEVSWSGAAGSGTTARFNVAVDLPVLVRVRGTTRGPGALLGPIQPNDTVAGATVAPGVRAAAALSLPAPTAVISNSPELELSMMSLGLTEAVLTTADLIWAGEKPGLACLTSAAAPATMAAAKLEPSTVV